MKSVPRPTLAIVQRPRPGKYLSRDLADLQADGVQILISLLPQAEAEFLGLGQEQKAARDAGLEFLSFPLPDHDLPPDTDAFRAFVVSLAARLWEHEAVGIHCQGSIGRSTLVAACALIHLGWSPVHALIDITAARGCPVPDTEEQQEWILHYEPEP